MTRCVLAVLCNGDVIVKYQVFEHYQKLLNSENYVTRRQSLKV